MPGDPDHGPPRLSRFARTIRPQPFAGSDSAGRTSRVRLRQIVGPFHPWSERQGQSGFAWSWLGAAMQATSLPFGMISAPGYRYHPAILAQAAATIGELFPARLWLALGSGEAINGAITGQAWPEKAERNARLDECVSVMRALLNGERVTHLLRAIRIFQKHGL